MKILKDIMFMDDEHERMFNQFCFQMKKLDCYHYVVAYLLSLDVVVRDHVQDVFDFKEDVIIPDGLERPWQTSTSRRTTKLLFNLWNGFCSGLDYTPDDIFCCSYAAYYCEALRLRYSMFF